MTEPGAIWKGCLGQVPAKAALKGRTAVATLIETLLPGTVLRLCKHELFQSSQQSQNGNCCH